MRCFVARGLPISRLADLMFEESPGINVEGREALHYLIQCMHKYGHKNRIGITLRRYVVLSDLPAVPNIAALRRRGLRGFRTWEQLEVRPGTATDGKGAPPEDGLPLKGGDPRKW